MGRFRRCVNPCAWLARGEGKSKRIRRLRGALTPTACKDDCSEKARGSSSGHLAAEFLGRLGPAAGWWSADRNAAGEFLPIVRVLRGGTGGQIGILASSHSHPNVLEARPPVLLRASLSQNQVTALCVTTGDRLLNQKSTYRHCYGTPVQPARVPSRADNNKHRPKHSAGCVELLCGGVTSPTRRCLFARQLPHRRHSEP